MINKKNILLLGGFGFIGLNLIEEFIQSDQYNIIVFSAKNTPADRMDIFKDVKIYLGDFNNENDLEKIFQENKIDIVFHLISTTIPSTSNEDIIYDIKSNLISTIRMLDLMVKNNVGKIVFFSSGGTIYGIGNEREKFSESDLSKPICSYGIIKDTIEKYLFLYNYLYGLQYLILRVSNPYGEYHNSEKQGLINVALKNILKGESVNIWGDGEAIRDYLYVGDLAKIVAQLIEKNIFNEVFNVGSGVGYSVNEIISVIRKVAGNVDVVKREARKVDVPRIILDNKKLQSINPFVFTDVEMGIREAYHWMKQNM